MHGEVVRHPVETITVGLTGDRPEQCPVNDDVAYALVTRFNVRMRIRKEHRWSHLEGRHLAESSDYDAFWLRRLDLFERVCIPSVLSLSPRPDAWFVGFGDVEAPYVRALLERLSAYPWVRPYVRKPGHPDDAGPLSELLASYVRSTSKPYLCSTRFDSDDSLHSQFIGGLDRAISLLRQRGFADELRCLNFVYGLMQSAGELSVHLRRTNMFSSVFEPADQVGGPYQVPHDEVRDRMPLVEIVSNVPMWIYHRHAETLEPAWVTARDRLPLGSPSMYYPMFGLDPDTESALRARSEETIGSQAPRSPQSHSGNSEERAAELRNFSYWNADQKAAAVELATSRDCLELASWLEGGEADAKKVLRAYESGIPQFLNGGQLARLGRRLREEGEIVGALRAFDYAVLVASSDRHVRAERDELADAISHELDIEEQMDLAGVAQVSEERGNDVVVVASTPTDDFDANQLISLLERLRRLSHAGFDVHVIMLPELGVPESASTLESFATAGAKLEALKLPKEPPAGLDATNRELTRQLARRVADINPGLLATDSTLTAQRMAAAVGRAFSIPVDFAIEALQANEEDLTHQG